MEALGCIYLITNSINGKRYIGQSKYVDPQIRWKAHVKSAKSTSPYALHSAIRKYGVDNFKIETVGVFKHAILGEMEAYYAEQYGCYTWDPIPGYNMVWCGKNFRLGITHTEESREKLRQAHTGRKQSAETIALRSAALTGKKRSQEVCDSISATKRANGISEEARQKLIECKTGKKMSLEARENMRKGHAARKENLGLESQIISSRPKREYRCDQCDKVLPKAGSLKLHKRTHTQEKPYPCNICNKAYACSSNLDEHKLKHNPKSFECDSCHALFTYGRTLKKHKEKFHTASYEKLPPPPPNPLA